jgi:hypothetical protein
MLKTDFVDNARWRTKIFQWFSWFKQGKTLIGDCKCSSWLSRNLDCEGTVHTKLLTTITTKRLCNVWGNNGRTRTSWFATAICLVHTALSVLQFLTAKNMTVLSYLPHSPKLAICGIFLFPRMKSQLQGNCFQDVPCSGTILICS